ncbi:MAG TPA: NrfD/PsrC family molybdoenzyme membrane anchor subunit [Gemmatimonadales bacterium]|nr:NrfD/PsrC family molybdoenzyme membrane anchor subunit [Gemmatimonadales bacterium]
MADTHPAPPSRVTYDYVTRTIARTLGTPSRGYFLLLAGAVTLLAIGIITLLFLLRYGLGLAGYSHPVYWAVFITCFVFWVGIAHSGTLISAILFLFRSGWRTAVYRTAEAMTVFAVMTAGLFPLIHIGRQWYFYWLIPYPNERGLWPNFKSPLIWDEFAIGTYFTVSTVFLIMGLIPDIAAVRDLATGWRKKLYAITSIGWTGSNEQWRHYSRGYLYLAALATPLVLSVHSVVSWDFAMALVPGWHATLFAPYFVAGAIYSGVAMVITLLVPIRYIFRLEELITIKHFENLGKLCLLTGLIVSYSYVTENFIAWFSGDEHERAAFWYRAFGPFWWASWTMNICNGLLPWLLWFKKVRTNITALFVISIFVNIGMWFERYVIIVVSLAGEPYTNWTNAVYNPTWADWGIMAGSFGWFFMWFLLFVKNFPAVSISEVKEVLPPPRRGRVAASR